MTTEAKLGGGTWQAAPWGRPYRCMLKEGREGHYGDCAYKAILFAELLCCQGSRTLHPATQFKKRKLKKLIRVIWTKNYTDQLNEPPSPLVHILMVPAISHHLSLVFSLFEFQSHPRSICVSQEVTVSHTHAHTHNEVISLLVSL